MSDTQKVAVITGGASGIGEAAAAMLHSIGVMPVIVDLDERLAKECAARYDSSYVVADVGRAEDWSLITDRIMKDHGRLDIAVLNAGIGTGNPDLQTVTIEMMERVVRVNMWGVVLGTRALTPMLNERNGSIVITASISGLFEAPADPIYSMTKHGIIGLARSLVAQLWELGVTINVICPSFTDTPLFNSNADQVALRRAEGVPLLQPEEVARAMLSLVTSGGTGQVAVCRAGYIPLLWNFSERQVGPADLFRPWAW
jgi:NAD(P)-dependent dehydrogenase (short-subunit alcohol dehydrogenase family)